MANQLVASSSLPPSWRYDVFLSFRGEDTRTSFTDHLYKALVDKGINTFIDRQLTRGEEISLALLQAIEESRISLVIFSKTYASSRWCLDELVKILQCRESKQQIVLPVFYKIEPSHVRNQTSSFGDAFTKLEGKSKGNKEKVLMWRKALREVANLSGHPVKEEDYEATIISNIVKEIFVRVLDGTYLNVAKHPVGIQSCVQGVKKLLGVDGNSRRVVGIWGTSGIGKTTIAKAVYNAIAHKFEGSCFLADIRETSMQHGGLVRLQNTILSELNHGSKWKVVNTHRGNSLIENLLRRKKILLILDDVDELEQLNNLAEVNWFGEGSRVIITTKDKGLLESYGVELIYEVQKLKDEKALELLSLNAFGSNEPPDNYFELTQRAIAYAQGLPLALNLIGSHLRKKSIDRWQAILDSYDSYEGEPYRDIQRVLRKSYDAWDDVVQQVFLDIACFFKGKDKDYVLQILKSSKLNLPQDCIEVLAENAIITIEYNRILMHDLLEKMGKRIVREESPIEPGKRSRLWFHEDVYHVLTENKGTKKIRGIVVELPKPGVIPLNAKSFLHMVNLEIFINRNACFSGRVDYLPNDLRWIELGGRDHQVKFNLQSNYHPRHLVMFDMPYSGIKQLIGFKNLAKLTSMNLRSCEFLEKLPDLSGSPNIKHLDLRDCKSLVEVDDSVGFLCKLVELNFSGCSNLTRFVTRLGLRSLKRLYLDGCTRLENFPEIEEDEMGSLMDLDIGKSGIKELPSSIAYLTRLQTLSAEGCENLTGASLHHIYGLQRLNEVYFGDCPKLVTFGNEVKFDEVASCSTEYQLIPTDLDTTCANRIKFSLPNLDYLDFDGCNLLEMDFLVPLDCWSTLTRLTVLNLSRNNFVSLPDCISKVANLEKLYLSGCKRLREIPQVLPPKLNYLCLNDCTSLEKIPKLPPMLKLLRLINCFRLSGYEVAKLENNLLNQESRRRSELKVILPGNEVPKWFSFTSDHLTTTEHRSKNEFRFEIPLYLLGDTLLGLALYVIIDAATPPDPNADILINGIQRCEKYLWYVRDMEATHVWLGLVDFDMRQQQGPFCEVIFHFPESARIKSCGVHCLSYEWLHLSSRPTSSLGKRTHPHRSSDIIDDAYEQQQQWLYLSPEKQRHKCDIEEEQERPSTSIDRQCVRSSKEYMRFICTSPMESETILSPREEKITVKVLPQQLYNLLIRVCVGCLDLMANPARFNMLNLMNIEKLNGNNFKSWKQQIDMHLGMLEFNIAFTQTQPTALTETSTAAEKETFAKWERANQMSLLIMQNSMEKHITGGIQNYDLAKQYMAKIEKKYKRTDKTEIGERGKFLEQAKLQHLGLAKLQLSQVLLILVPRNMLPIVLDLKISLLRKGFQNRKSQSKEHYNVYVGNGNKVTLESIGQVMLKLSSGYVLVLNNVLYLSSMRRNLLSATKFVKDGFSFIADDNYIRFYSKNQYDNLLGFASLNVDLWQVQCTYFYECLNVDTSTPKRMITNYGSSFFYAMA